MDVGPGRTFHGDELLIAGILETETFASLFVLEFAIVSNSIVAPGIGYVKPPNWLHLTYTDIVFTL